VNNDPLLAAGCPGQVPQRLDPLLARDQIHPVAHFEPPHHGQQLIRRQIERVERQPEVFVFYERKEPEGTVPSPLQDQRLRSPLHERLDKALTLAKQCDVESLSLEQSPIGRPARRDGLGRIVEQVDVVRDPARFGQRIERGGAGHVALAASHARLGH
jgi:hypothetical protein